jgi:hypothetical protein
VGEKGGDRGFTDPALSGNYDPDSRPSCRALMVILC